MHPKNKVAYIYVKFSKLKTFLAFLLKVHEIYTRSYSIVTIKVYYKTEVRTWRFREALKKLVHNNANTTFIVICLIF